MKLKKKKERLRIGDGERDHQEPHSLSKYARRESLKRPAELPRRYILYETSTRHRALTEENGKRLRKGNENINK